ncbi:ATP-dependent RNA helicase Dbp3 [Schizosaccharomyces cryophilus OY26]|uniref:RNA helicase n=1 Tax=Schizosaccharomyces cryophilus (strain OY26 / ATCC MYA-4695 / CBS 11777 / NBRC 106824 / NRRL Y48691) TaxID=653667 RepID=S9XA64_SCHCR|nr:ATP-dependent RNA helicase Dbp3 [Schizosaccharomyces cryophilus OY26]EPY50661.1 ATP-dependent RNA helicase Dbp3 [Schizosaccharomyces cryophilus OY26]
MGKRSIKEVKDAGLEKNVEGEAIKRKEKKAKHEHKKEKKEKKSKDKSDTKKKDKKEKKRKEKSDSESASQEGGSNDEEEKNTLTEGPSQSVANEAACKEYAKKHEINYVDPISQTPLLPVLNFSELPIADNLRLGLKNFKEPTPIQSASWPYLFAGRDVVGIAETGSGKTVAFGIPALQYLQNLPDEKPTTRILVVSPTRELAIQTYENIKGLTSDVSFKVAVVYGGAPKSEQARAARNASVVIGTPGRLLDLINDGAVDCSNVGYLVLDEADRMLDTGFEQDIRNIISQTPNPLKGEARQTVFYSATWPESVRALAATFLKDPVKITIGSDELSASQNITQIIELLDDSRSKERSLINCISKNLASAGEGEKILVFVLYKKEAARVENTLARRFNAVGIHGDMSQAARLQALESFKSGKSPVLVATDVAARGLDIPKVQLVINVTFPLTIEDYIHRIGRTGRANTKGVAHTFFTPEDKSHAGELINVLRQAKQDIPEGLYKYGTAVKPKLNAYGNRVTNDAPMKAATKITFD